MLKWNTLLSLVILLWTVGCGPDIPGPTPEHLYTIVDRSVAVVEDEVAGQPIVVVGSQGRPFFSAFDRRLNGELLGFQAVQSRFPVVMEDNYGNLWNVFGEAVQGPNAGQQLEWVPASTGYWFMFGAMHPGIYLYGYGDDTVTVQRDTATGWGVPTNAVQRGSEFDGIPALDDPVFTTPNPLESRPGEAFFYLEDEDLVVVVRINGETKVYPHAILDWHEIINDEIGGVPVAVTYSPLTSSTKVWERDSTTFGVTGLESYWLQWEGRAVHGSLKGNYLKQLPFLETSWGAWRLVDPTPVVVADEQPGHDNPYGSYPYGDYANNDFVSYPLLHDDQRLPPKQRVFCILLNGTPKVYPLEIFKE
ncbi:MAG: DUF3179 domain-containing protein [Bacteroidetes bacterium]|jgi:hypothetical protein|nr:DUF3179 domain-containing protein [Bacteroidota bacterium]